MLKTVFCVLSFAILVSTIGLPAMATPLFGTPPSIIVQINGSSYSSSFTPVTLDGGVSYLISGTITNETPDNLGQTHPDAFTFSLNVVTHPDPDIVLETSISGDPTVGIRITQVFLGGPLFNLVTISSGIIADLNGDQHASVFGSPFIQTTAFGGVVIQQQNTGCDIGPPTGVLTQCGPISQTSQTLLVSQPDPFIPPIGVLEMDIGFTLSDGDIYTLRSSASLTPVSEVPEPAAMVLIVAGLLAMAGATLRRNRNLRDTFR